MLVGHSSIIALGVGASKEVEVGSHQRYANVTSLLVVSYSLSYLLYRTLNLDPLVQSFYHGDAHPESGGNRALPMDLQWFALGVSLLVVNVFVVYRRSNAYNSLSPCGSQEVTFRREFL
jgi:hypothetical protein